MAELKCPVCQRVITVRKARNDVICQNCLEASGTTVIMIESREGPNIVDLGGGLFEER
jgi:hypothetical protein